jgi:hypothetical protein
MALSMYRYPNNFRNKLKQKQNLDTLKINYIVKSYTWQSVAIFVNSDISQFPKCLRSYMGFTSTIFPDSHHRALKQKFVNIKRVIRRSKWKKNRQYSDKKWRTKDKQLSTKYYKKTKDWATRTTQSWQNKRLSNTNHTELAKLKIEQHEPHRAGKTKDWATRTTQIWQN